jgi:hypothetical protein
VQRRAASAFLVHVGAALDQKQRDLLVVAATRVGCGIDRPLVAAASAEQRFFFRRAVDRDEQHGRFGVRLERHPRIGVAADAVGRGSR